MSRFPKISDYSRRDTYRLSDKFYIDQKTFSSNVQNIKPLSHDIRVYLYNNSIISYYDIVYDDKISLLKDYLINLNRSLSDTDVNVYGYLLPR